MNTRPILIINDLHRNLAVSRVLQVKLNVSANLVYAFRGVMSTLTDTNFYLEVLQDRCYN